MKKESFIIKGIAGKKTLKGSVTIGGAKNSALKAIAAAVLFDGPVELRNVPNNSDIHTMSAIMEKIGCTVTFANSVLRIDTAKINSTVIDTDLASKMRASVVLTGPLLARFGKASFPAPGGCVIGARPIDQFIKGYERMGATMVEDNNNYNIEIKIPVKDLDYTFELPGGKKTVGGTETLMMASVLGYGTVTLRNCAMEPEIVNIAEWLNACGADIKGVGTDTIVIKGTGGKLLSPKAAYTAIPDRVEAGSYLLLGALCAEELKVDKCEPKHLESLTTLLRGSGVPLEIGADFIAIKGNTAPNSSFKAFNVTTREYPGFPTDLQSQITTFLTQVSGISTVVENIFEGRLKYVADLQQMGARITIDSPKQVTIQGPADMHALPAGKELNAHDIRAGFAIVMAALVAAGDFKINNVHLIDRGYEKLEERLIGLGAQIRRA